MTVKIEISDGPTTRSFQYDGRNITVHEQRGYVHIPGQKYPVEMNVSLEDSSRHYSPGVYQVDPSSFMVDRYKNLGLSKFLKLVPVK